MNIESLILMVILLIFGMNNFPKNKVFSELSVEKFIKHLVAHIPPKGFKMIRKYRKNI